MKIMMGKILDIMNKKYERYINYILNELERPYFKNMRDNYGVNEKEYELILSKVLDQPVTIVPNNDGTQSVFDKDYNRIYFERSTGEWTTNGYDNRGNRIYAETDDGYWERREYDNNDNEVYTINSYNFWQKWEYDNNNNVVFYENSDGFWSKHTYDEVGEEIYYQDSRGISYEI